MRVLIYGNAPWVPSGYGTQARQMGRTFRSRGHEVAYAPFHGLQGAPLTWEGCTVFPGSGEDAWSLDLLPAHYRNFSADLLITLMDAWVLEPSKLAGMNIAHWMPVDCSPLSAMDRKVLDVGGGRPVAMSQFGHKQMLDAGYDALYAPHALDMETWKPLEDRDAARREFGWQDRFVIGINAANQDPFRKGFGEQLAAFAAFSARHSDACMLIHSRAETRQGTNLAALIDDLGLRGKAVLGDQYLIAGGLVSDGQMISWHGACDVISNCSYGEGFGLSVLQAQACGTPVVVNGFSAMDELCGAGWKVEGQRFWNRGHNASWQVPFISSIEQAYETAYEQAACKRDEARAWALPYDASRVYDDHWAEVLAELGPKQVPADAGAVS